MQELHLQLRSILSTMHNHAYMLKDSVTSELALLRHVYGRGGGGVNHFHFELVFVTTSMKQIMVSRNSPPPPPHFTLHEKGRLFATTCIRMYM